MTGDVVVKQVIIVKVQVTEMSLFFCLGKKLSDLERVTSLKVYNWFANRRKEIKRRANIGNVASGREHKRPLRLFLFLEHHTFNYISFFFFLLTELLHI